MLKIGSIRPLTCQKWMTRSLPTLLRRGLSSSPTAHTNPLEFWLQESMTRNLCDEQGFRRPGVHWVFCMGVSADAAEPPFLKNVGIQRLSLAGIDFVIKRNPESAATTPAMSLLYSQGRYVAGEETRQWRAEGLRRPISVTTLLETLPHYTIVGMIASRRLELETGAASKSHMTEIMQTTRIELENGEILRDELEECIQAWRFVPQRLECLTGGPDAIMWDRWEWTLKNDKEDDSPLEWNDGHLLLPH